MGGLLLAAYIVNSSSTVIEHQKGSNLENSIFPLLTSWEVHWKTPLSNTITKVLELDEYVNHTFSKGQDVVSLYIGFYATQKKVGAAHSPLVCFPGQGWNLSDYSDLKIHAGNDTINLASMVIGKGEEQQLVLYWFQAYEQTSPGTFMQKVNLLKAKLLYSREDNAFVRVMVSFGRERTKEDAQKIGLQFIDEFYPLFKNYITN